MDVAKGLGGLIHCDVVEVGDALELLVFKYGHHVGREGSVAYAGRPVGVDSHVFKLKVFLYIDCC